MSRRSHPLKKTRPRAAASRIRHGPECLERRWLLAGVTLITHGFNSNVDSWVSEMADAINARPESLAAQSRYRVDVTDPGHDGGPLSVVNTARTGPAPAASSAAEITVLLNWSDVAGTVAIGGGYHRSTVDIAAAVADKLVAANFLSDFPFPLAQLPFHLIGHSRGASLVGELAKKLGEYGVWVDQVTTLDPHPVDGVREPALLNFNFGDAAMTAWENVTYWDNYWRTEGTGSLDFTGETIPNTYSLQLNESVLSGGGYSNEHSDVHLWYHGTIDTSAGADDGSASVPANWYGGVHPARGATGYYYSRLVGGPRNAAGLAASLGGAAVRAAIDWSAAAWPNLLEMNVGPGDGSYTIGQAIPATFDYLDTDSESTVLLFIDPDRNPYNANEQDGGFTPLSQTAAAPQQTSASLVVPGAAPGVYFVGGRISDAAGHVRYAYASGAVTLVAPPELVVTNTLDAGTGSLRQALLDANSSEGGDTIRFAIAAAGLQLIVPASALPVLSDETIFDLPAGQDVQMGAAAGFALAGYPTLTKRGAGRLSLGGDQTRSEAAALIVEEGTLNLVSDGGSNLTITARQDGSRLSFAAGQHLAALELTDGAIASLAAAGNLSLVLGSLAITGDAVLDLADNILVIRADAATRDAALANTTAQLASGANHLAWNGPGIHSSVAAADPSRLSSLGVMLNDNGLGGAYRQEFGGVPVDVNSVLVKFTYYGDADLSGAVDGTDYALIDNGFNAGARGWFNGDFDYSLAVDGTDYALIDNGFNSQGAPLASSQPPAARSPRLPLVGVASSDDRALPEPNSVWCEAAISSLFDQRQPWWGRRRGRGS